MVELTRVTTERSLSFKNSYMIWLLALLSSQEPCNIHVYNVVPFMVDYLHQSIKNNYAAVTEACNS